MRGGHGGCTRSYASGPARADYRNHPASPYLRGGVRSSFEDLVPQRGRARGRPLQLPRRHEGEALVVDVLPVGHRAFVHRGEGDTPGRGNTEAAPHHQDVGPFDSRGPQVADVESLEGSRPQRRLCRAERKRAASPQKNGVVPFPLLV